MATQLTQGEKKFEFYVIKPSDTDTHSITKVIGQDSVTIGYSDSIEEAENFVSKLIKERMVKDVDI